MGAFWVGPATSVRGGKQKGVMVAFWRQGVSSSQKHLVDLVSHQGKVGGSHTLYFKAPQMGKTERGSW